MKVDYLILLLSTDWFLPFWSEIGFDLDDPAKRQIQVGCRAIVRKFMADANEYYQIDLSDERRRESYSMLLGLLESEARQSASTAAAEVWLHGPQDDMRSAIMLRMLTHELLSGDQEGGVQTLAFPLRVNVVEATKNYDVDPNQFGDLSAKSESAWDKYVQGLFVETPTALSDIVGFIVQERRMKELWNQIWQRLTQSEIQDLISWYRAIVQSRGFPSDPVPCYIRQMTNV